MNSEWKTKRIVDNIKESCGEEGEEARKKLGRAVI